MLPVARVLFNETRSAKQIFSVHFIETPVLCYTHLSA